MSDAHREWWGRLGGLLMLYASLLVRALPDFDQFSVRVEAAFELGIPASLSRASVTRRSRARHTSGRYLTWILSTAYGVFFGKSEKTANGIPMRSLSKKFSLWPQSSPRIFSFSGCCWASRPRWPPFSRTWVKGLDSSANLQVPTFGILIFEFRYFACYFLSSPCSYSWRVNINEFSIHYLYRNRLVRCYLGAIGAKTECATIHGIF